MFDYSLRHGVEELIHPVYCIMSRSNASLSLLLRCLENLAPIPLDPIHLEGSLSVRNEDYIGDNKSFASHFMIEGYLEPRTIYSSLFVRIRSGGIRK